MGSLSRFAKFAWATVGYTLLVILWGAFVRATGSGAGCGSHWPLCNGEVLPRAAQIETLIEFTHRLTSAFAGVLALILLVWAFRLFEKGHRVRRMAMLSMLFMLTEGAIGAALVRLELVAHDDSALRAFFIALHLNNTFLLVAFLTFTAWYASNQPSFSFLKNGTQGWLLLGGTVGLVLVGSTGAITALGDTLILSNALPTGPDASATVHFLERLRIWHPFTALLVSMGLLYVIRSVMQVHRTPLTLWLGNAMQALILGQLALGLLNIYLKAPVWIQLVHLLLADLLWIGILVFSAAALAPRTPPAAATN